MNKNILIISIIVLVLILFFVLSNFLKNKKRLSAIISKYKDVLDLDEFKLKANQELESIKSDIQKLKDEYAQKRAIFNSLLKEISLYEEEIEISSYGLYKPHYDFDTSESYRKKLEEIRDKQRILIREEEAFSCKTEWRINNNLAEGRRQTKHFGKLMLRAFNGECDAMLSNVRWNNIMKMEERLEKSFEAINKLGSTHMIEITLQYKNIKLEELRLAYEYQEKLNQEKEEQRQIREEMREEEKAQKELEKAAKEAEDEEKRNSKALEQARIELGKAQGAQVDSLTNKIAELERDLQEAREKKARAISQAQLTKSGHIYVISNIGSFGENVYKIGMTRRLEPMDRIRELGDASVPFNYDVHAILYTENAPEIENRIQKRFEDRRLNLINTRREFFNVTLEEIEQVAKEHKADIEFTKISEAREFRESQALREQRKLAGSQIATGPSIEQKFPDSI